MDPATGREFSFVNPQDDPDMYPAPPPGFQYDIDGKLYAIPVYNDVKTIIGMDVKAATVLMQKRDMSLRVVEEDGIPFMLRHDFRKNRINIKVQEGKVSAITGTF